MGKETKELWLILMTFVCVVSVILLGSGCASIYKALGTDAETVHSQAIEKVSEYAIDVAEKKIDASADLSEEGKAKLKAEVQKLRDEILERIEAIRQKVKDSKAKKAEAAFVGELSQS